jgi:hypothetical protein
VEDSNFTHEAATLSTKATRKQHVAHFQQAIGCCRSPSSTLSKASFSLSLDSNHPSKSDKCKAPIINALPLNSNLQYSIINALDIPLQYYYGYALSYLVDSTITNTQEITKFTFIPLLHTSSIGPSDIQASHVPRLVSTKSHIFTGRPPEVHSYNMPKLVLTLSHTSTSLLK